MNTVYAPAIATVFVVFAAFVTAFPSNSSIQSNADQFNKKIETPSIESNVDQFDEEIETPSIPSNDDPFYQLFNQNANIEKILQASLNFHPAKQYEHFHFLKKVVNDGGEKKEYAQEILNVVQQQLNEILKAAGVNGDIELENYVKGVYDLVSGKSVDAEIMDAINHVEKFRDDRRKEMLAAQQLEMQRKPVNDFPATEEGPYMEPLDNKPDKESKRSWADSPDDDSDYDWYANKEAYTNPQAEMKEKEVNDFQDAEQGPYMEPLDNKPDKQSERSWANLSDDDSDYDWYANKEAYTNPDAYNNDKYPVGPNTEPPSYRK